MKNKRRCRIIIKWIVILSVAVVFAASLIITNIFIPIKYFFAYVNFSQDINPGGQMRIRYLDVGYGNSTLVELPDGKTLLIDGGTGTYSNTYSLLQVLNASGIDKIDYLICTSVKSEHCGTISELVKYKRIDTAFIPFVKNIYVTDEYAAFHNELLRSGAKIQTAEYGKGAYSEDYGYFFCFLSPAVHTYEGSEYNVMNSAPTPENIDNASAVVWLQFEDRGFLLLSDAGGDVQLKIAKNMLAEDKNCNINGKIVHFSDRVVVSAAKHGGKNSVEPMLYELIMPEAAIISVGKNAQSAPSLTAIADMQLYVYDNVYRTDFHGTITVTVKTNNYSISKEKG